MYPLTSALENSAVYAASCPGPRDPHFPMATVQVLSEKTLGHSDGPILLGTAELPRDVCVVAGLGANGVRCLHLG